jgi:hypothetical protein
MREHSEAPLRNARAFRYTRLRRLWGRCVVHIEVIRELLTSGPTQAGRAACLICDAIPMNLRPAWAAGILALACSRLPKVPARVKAVIALGRARRRWWWNPWRLAHAAFGAVRDLTLAEDQSHARGEVYLSVLIVAEYAAKVIYNASGVNEPVRYGRPAPFDEDCGSHLVGSLWHLARAVGSPAFDQQAWALLESWLRKVPTDG